MTRPKPKAELAEQDLEKSPKEPAQPESEERALPANKRARKGLLSDIRGRLPKGQGALTSGDLIRRRKVSFVMDGSACAPEFFVDEEGDYYDFEVTLQELNSAEEINCYKTAGAQGQAVMALARAMLCEVEGERVTDEMRDLIWDAFGQKGRALCVAAMQTIASVGQIELGKFNGTFSVS